MNATNNLQALNDKLFDLFEQIKDDKISVEKANAMVSVSNTIINNAKIQMQGIKQFHELGYEPNATGSSTVQRMIGNIFDRKFEFAKSIGHQNIAEAIAKLGKEKFEILFDQSQKQL